MKPTCPECEAELALPSLTKKQLGSLDTDSLKFNCAKCDKELSVGDFIKGGVAGMFGGAFAFGKNADGEESLLDELNPVDSDSSLDDGLGLDELDLGDSLDLDKPGGDAMSAGVGTPDLGIADIDGDGDSEPDLSVVSDEVAEDDFVVDELTSLDKDEDTLEFASDELELSDDGPAVAGSLPLDGAAPKEDAPKDADADDDIDWLADELADDDTDLEFDDTLVDSGDDTPDVVVGEKPSMAIDDDEFDLELSDAEDAVAGQTVDGLAGEFEPADSDDTVAAAGIFEMRDPPLAASLAEPVAPSGDGHATDEPTAPFGFEQEPQPGSYKTAPLAPKKGGLLGTLAKVGIGGLLALAVAQGAAWWGLGMDPAGLAGVVPEFMVPQSLRKQVARVVPSIPAANPGSAAKDDGMEEDTHEFQQDMGSKDQAVADGSGTAGDGSGTAGNGSGTVAPGVAEGSGMANDDGSANANVMDGSGTNGDLASDDGSGTVPEEDVSAMFDDSGMDDLASDMSDDTPEATDESQDDLADLLGAADPPVVEAASPFAGGAPNGFPTYTTQDLAGVIPVATRALQRFEEARLTNSPDLNPVAKEFYFAINDVAEQATLATRGDGSDVLSKSRDLLRSLNEDQQGRCSAWAHAWLNKDYGKGVVFAADVVAVSKSGDLYELALTLANKRKTQVMAVTRMNPADNPVMTFKSGSRLLLMGVIVKDPGQSLPGYSSLESKVVYITDQIVEGK